MSLLPWGWLWDPGKMRRGEETSLETFIVPWSWNISLSSSSSANSDAFIIYKQNMRRQFSECFVFSSFCQRLEACNSPAECEDWCRVRMQCGWMQTCSHAQKRLRLRALQNSCLSLPTAAHHHPLLPTCSLLGGSGWYQPYHCPVPQGGKDLWPQLTENTHTTVKMNNSMFICFSDFFFLHNFLQLSVKTFV